MNYSILALIITNVIWGAAIPIFKYSLVNVPPFIFLFIRSFGAALIFLPATFLVHQRLSIKDFVNIFIASLTGIAIPIALLFLGLQRAPSLNFALIVTTSPLLIYFSAVLLLKERPHNKILAGGMAAFIGALFVILAPILTTGKFQAGEFTGNILFLFASISNVISILFIKKTLKKINIFELMFFMFALTAIVLIPLIYVEFQTWSFDKLTAQGLVGLIYGTIFSSAVAYFLQHYALLRINAQEVGIFSYLQPIVAILVAIPLLHEYPSVHYYVGSILVIIGVFIAEFHIRKRKK